jgi:hypothetical protein
VGELGYMMDLTCGRSNLGAFIHWRLYLGMPGFVITNRFGQVSVMQGVVFGYSYSTRLR